MAEEIVVKLVIDSREATRKAERDFEASRKAMEAKELAHQRRIEAIHLQSGSRLQQIEARRQAQIDLIRERATQREIARQRQLEQATRSAFGGTLAVITAVTAATLAAAAAMKRFAEVSIQAAIDVNKQVNTLKALTGSAEAAEKRFAALFAIAQKTPGLTTNLAATLDAQLRVFSVTEKTIDRLLPAIGRLNAISPISDPRQFVNNFTQLISQNFERQDLKELVGQSPIAGLLIKEIFDVDNPTNAAAIRTAAKRLGITTVERLAEEFADAAATNSALRNATESFAGQFEKLQDRITVALAPIGEELLRVLLPAFREFVDLLERDLPKITALLRDNRDEFVAVASAILTVASAVGTLIGALAKLDQQFGFVRVLSLMASSMILPGSAGAVSRFFDRQDQRNALLAVDPALARQISLATGDKSLMPTNQQLRDFALANGDLKLFASVPPDPPPARTGGLSGLGGGGRATVGAAQRERDREVKDLIRKQAENIADRREQDLRDFEDLNRLLQVALVEEETRLQGVAGRPAQLAAFGAAQAERIRQIEIEDARLTENTAKQAAEALAKLPPILSDSERFMRGFADATLTAGDAFEQFGSDVARAFTNVRDLFGSLKLAVLNFFNNLVGSALQNLVRSTLGGLFGGGGGIGNLFGNLFRSAGGGGISTPASISQAIGGGFGGGSSAASGFGKLALDPLTAKEFGLGGSFLGGIGKNFAAAAPLLGLGLGGALGGQSIAGNILGSAGGLLGGGAVAGFSGALGAKAAAFFTNPFTIAIGAGLLVGSFFLGRAKQRRSDEELSGQFLTQALQGIQQLAAGVASGSIPSSQARGIFDRDILGVFKQQISGLKTKSVRESRLTNQVRDLERNYQDVVGPAIAEQARRAENASRFSRQVPEFATGGTSLGGLAILHPGEKVLNRQQQSAVRAMAGVNVFERAGVPGIQHSRVFEHGGTMPAGGALPIVIDNLNVSLLVGKDDATRIVVTGGSTTAGRAVTVKNINVAKTNREL